MSQGWKVSLILPDQIYIRDYYQSLREVLLCTLLIAVLIGALAFCFRKSVYTPLQLFDRQLEELLTDDFDASAMHSSIPEYERLLGKVSKLQRQIQEMIQEIIRQEQVNTKTQTEKLRAQINPHFLLNTLNTMHWMALINERPEIDSITQALSHLLSYNLDKDSVSTNLERELPAFGISLSYVIRSLHEFFSEDCFFEVQSTEISRNAQMSYGYFSRIFKKLMNVSPSEFRKNT